MLLGLRAHHQGLQAAGGAPLLHRLHGGRRDARHLALPRRGGGPHLTPGRGRQLLGRRPHRPLRPLLRDLLRPGRGVRLRESRLRSRLRLRPLPRVLEPRVHPVRPAGGRLHARAAPPQPRYGHGPGAHGGHHAARELQLRRRPHAGPHRPRREDLRQGLRPHELHRRFAQPAHHRRRRPCGGLPHRRRRPARQRGPRLRAAPSASPRGVPRPPARHRGRVPRPVHRRGQRAHG